MIALFLRQLLIEVRKSVFSLVFVVCVIFVVLMCMCTEVYRDAGSDRAYSVIEYIMKNDRKLIRSDHSFAAEMIFPMLLGSQYARISVPLLSSLPFLAVYSEELKGTFYRYELCRSTKLRTVLSRFAGCMISGGAVMLAGVLIYAAVVFSVFPGIASYGLDEELASMLIKDKTSVTVCRQAAGYTVYGAFSAVLPMVIFEVFRNVSVTASLTFMLTYIYYIILNKLAFRADFNEKYGWLSPHAIVSVFAAEKADAKVILLNISFTLLCFLALYLYKTRKSDISE